MPAEPTADQGDESHDEPEGPSMPTNRLMRAIDQSPSVGTALGGFGAYMFGALLLIVSVFVLLPGLLFVLATIGSGSWENRLLGVGLLMLGTVLFAVGRWATGQYEVQRRR